MISPHILRSGNLFKMSVPTTTISHATPSSTTITSSINSLPIMTSPTIKLLHQDPTIKKFDGENLTEYSALNSIQSCEDQMTGSSIQTGADKISFVRSQLIPGSLAAEMMSASAFNIQSLNGDYAIFRANFLQAFGISHTSDFQWSFRYVDALNNHLGSLGHMRAQARSAELATEAMNALKQSSWINNGYLSENSLRDILEFQYYISFLTPQERRIASAIEFKPGDNLLQFSTQIRKKLKEIQPSYVAPVVSTSTYEQLSENTPVLDSTSQPNRLQCSYCHKNGHTISHCFKYRRSRNTLKSPRASSPTFSEHSQLSTSSTRSHPQHNLRYNRPPVQSSNRSFNNYSSNAQRNSQPRSFYSSNKYSSHNSNKNNSYNNRNNNNHNNCLIHGPGHSSEQCRKLQSYINSQSNKHNRNFQPVPFHLNPT